MIVQDFFGDPIKRLKRSISECDHAASKSCTTVDIGSQCSGEIMGREWWHGGMVVALWYLRSIARLSNDILCSMVSTRTIEPGMEIPCSSSRYFYLLLAPTALRSRCTREVVLRRSVLTETGIFRVLRSFLRWHGISQKSIQLNIDKIK